MFILAEAGARVRAEAGSRKIIPIAGAASKQACSETLPWRRTSKYLEENGGNEASPVEHWGQPPPLPGIEVQPVHGVVVEWSNSSVAIVATNQEHLHSTV